MLLDGEDSPGATLRARRNKLGLSQSALAGVLGATPNTVARWERGELRIGNPERVSAVLSGLEAKRADTSLIRGTLPSHRQPIPYQLTSFIGREREIAEVKQLLDANRLVVLTGTGGMGKTRLALRLVEEVAEQFADGVVFVPLAPITDPALVLPSLAYHLGVQDLGGQQPLQQRLEHAIGCRQLLLVLDNFEHVLSVAPILVALLSACPQLKALVTSRAPLHVSGEQIYPVPPLRLLPSGKPTVLGVSSALSVQSEAVELFCARARAVNPSFAITPARAGVVAEICRRLEGLPLAIELAAARTRVLSPTALAAHLGHQLDVLVNGTRDAPQRHQTMRAAIGWSYDLLSTGQQAVFRQAAAFAGDWSLEAAEAVITEPGSGANTLSMLSSLVDQGLVQADLHTDGDVRFRLLETVCQYALERLTDAGAADAARRRHATYFLAVAEGLGAAGGMYAPHAAAGLDRLQREQDNVRAALRWAIDACCADVAGRLAHSLWSFWYARSQFAEAHTWLAEVLNLPEHRARTQMRAKLLHAAGAHANSLGEYQTAHECQEEALGIARELEDEQLVAAALFGLGVISERQGEHPAAWTFYSGALALYREQGHPQREAMTLFSMCSLAQKDEDYATMRVLGTEAVTLGRASDSPYALGRALTALGDAALGEGDLQLAHALFWEALALGRKLESPHVIGLALQSLGEVAAAQRESDDARRYYAESLDEFRRSGNRPRMLEVLEKLVALTAREGQPERALQVAAAVAAVREALGAPARRRSQRLLAPGLEHARQALGPSRAAASWASGRLLSLEDACTTALSAPVHASAGTGGWVAAPAAVAGRLTQREQEVASLVAQGLTNPQIAATLIIGRRTVQTHVSHILGKLGLSTRTQLAASVAQGGVGPARLSVISVRHLADVTTSAQS